jgi:hypothetical protein
MKQSVKYTGPYITYEYWHFKENNNSVALVRERTIPTVQPPLVGEVIYIYRV